MTDQEWDAAVPPKFLRYMRTFDLRIAHKGNGRARATVSGMTDAIRRTGVLHDEDTSLPLTCFPFVIPKNDIQCSLILSCVGIHRGLHLKPPKFSLASWEGIGRWMAEQPSAAHLYGIFAYRIFLCLPRAERNQRFLFDQNESMNFCCSGGFSNVPDVMEASVLFISTVFHMRSVSCRCLYLGFRASCAARVTRVTCSKRSLLGVPLELE